VSTVWRNPKLGLGHTTLKPEGVDQVDVPALEARLRASVRGQVAFDAGNRAAYSHDSSNYRQPPIGVVVPRDADDIVASVAACHAHGAPVLARGCGTGLAGQTCNVAVVIDHSRHMRTIKQLDPEARIAVVEPGVVHDQLTNMTEKKWNLTFGPDTSTHAYATFGGMIGNNSCGTHSVMAGRTCDNIRDLEIVTYDGLRMRVGETSDAELERIIAEGGRRGEIYARMRDLRDRYADRIRERYPQIPRRVSGYNLDYLLPERGFNVAKALVGSESTLVTVLEATLELVEMPPCRSLLVLGYEDIWHAADHVMEIRDHGAIALEAVDDTLINDMKLMRTHEQDIAMLPEGKGWLLVEFGAETREEADEQARKCMKRLAKEKDAPQMKLLDQRPNENRLWQVREGGLGATAFNPMEADHWEGWEDAAVHPEKLGSYLRDFRDLLKRFDYDTSMYGHFGDGCVHCRINFDLRSAGGIQHWRRFVDEAADLVVSYGGSLSGEHGDGQSRGELLPKMFGEDLVQAFGEFKSIWDPQNRMNPHKVVDPYPIVSNMKLGADYSAPHVDTFFSYPEDGGQFAHAAMRCVGAGKCRDIESGTMCPSYMVTRDEQHSTRGRTRILYEMLQGDVITDGFRSDEVEEALHLCLSCKGCKADCPVSVDMATYKAEFLAKHFKRRLRPRAAYSMGLINLHARLASRMPRIANFAASLGFVKKLGGIAPQREVPKFAQQTFKEWFAARACPNPEADPVVLFADTFNNHLHPQVAKATTLVLEAAGYRVVVPEQPLCCGRPLYDYGMLPTARRYLKSLVDGLRPWIRSGVPVVGIEPSCVAVFRDELAGMLPDDSDANRLNMQTLTVAEFLEQHAPGWQMPRLEGQKAIVHGHCHQKAVMGMSAEQKVYERMGLDYELLDSGCCGLAGSWGFEDGHYDLSVQIGERRLLPKVRELGESTLVLADGFSCKTQIEQLTGRQALHTAEVLAMALDQAANRIPAQVA
jgi:FAD/FMN-containing dehydrogenase/Fe-S oxidoreductase